MKHVLDILALILSWQGVVLLAVFVLRKPLIKLVDRFTLGDAPKAKFGSIEIDLGKLVQDGSKAVDNLNEINLIVARGKLIEFEFAERSVGATFNETQKKELSLVVRELRLKLRDLEKQNV
ncbi:hypothetical protein CTM93_13035 [Photobacterium phosphoreum]|uniref:hypothetical protein n=1 Tax=Photobacterium phosphoreum TaxID=659 RepID=UPI000D182A0C|nr:hypothetical protein [Photobacterium phosphoreum]PSU82513.1 hypothetical protein CTM93_13035 [Photobacterium phosphoreum]